MKLNLFKCLCVLGGTLSVGNAATLTQVPMQGMMMHVGIEYLEDPTPQLHIHITNATPVLVPLSVSDPTSHFASDAAWYDALDPDARGLAFNRQYGFVRGGDLLPEGQTIWIRQLSATPQLEVYAYRMNQGTFTPMFGTAGSSDVLQWDQNMFHPCYAAPTTLDPCEASYEAFVVDAAGQPVGLSAPFTLSWPVIKPLQISSVAPSNGQSVINFTPPAAWVTTPWVYAVESSTNLIDWAWVGSITNPPAGPQSLTDPAALPAGACYRLRALLP